MAVAFDASSTSHTSGSASTNQASFSWTHTPVGTPKGIYVQVNTYVTSDVDYGTSVTYGGVALSRITQGVDFATSAEPGATAMWWLGAGIPTGAQSVVVNRVNNATQVTAFAISVTADKDYTSAAGQVVVGLFSSGTKAIEELSIDDRSPGTNSLRIYGLYTGLATPPTAGANSTRAQLNDLGAYGSAIYYETTPGQGSRLVGPASSSADDVAAIAFAVVEENFPAFTNTPINRSPQSTVFTHDGIWRKPPGCTFIEVISHSAGGGGGGATNSTTAAVRRGGSGGGGGSYNRAVFRASDFGANVIVGVGQGGAGGPGGGTAGANDGTVGGPCAFGGRTICYGGGGGLSGSTGSGGAGGGGAGSAGAQGNAATAALGGQPQTGAVAANGISGGGGGGVANSTSTNAFPGEYGGGGGTSSTNNYSAITGIPGGSLFGGAGGGAGGGVTTTNVEGAGGSGGLEAQYGTVAGAAGGAAGGANPGTNGNNGVVGLYGGGGGAGGGGSNTTGGGNGGIGGFPGGGGGGGGGGTTSGGLGGTGGRGGDGAVIVTSY